jgi:hypothetical protein
MRIHVAAVVALLMAGCSSQPTAGSSTAAPAPVPAAAAAKGTAPPAVPAPEPYVAARPAEERQKTPPGYKSVERNGQVFYCKAASQTGTRFTRPVCLTPEQYAATERASAEMRESMQRRSSLCNSPGGNCGGS